jgi:hypothetical protein
LPLHCVGVLLGRGGSRAGRCWARWSPHRGGRAACCTPRAARRAIRRVLTLRFLARPPSVGRGGALGLVGCWRERPEAGPAGAALSTGNSGCTAIGHAGRQASTSAQRPVRVCCLARLRDTVGTDEIGTWKRHLRVCVGLCRLSAGGPHSSGTREIAVAKRPIRKLIMCRCPAAPPSHSSRSHAAHRITRCIPRRARQRRRRHANYPHNERGVDLPPAVPP